MGNVVVLVVFEEIGLLFYFDCVKIGVLCELVDVFVFGLGDMFWF